jgi:hypothetical protein
MQNLADVQPDFPETAAFGILVVFFHSGESNAPRTAAPARLPAAKRTNGS